MARRVHSSRKEYMYHCLLLHFLLKWDSFAGAYKAQPWQSCLDNSCCSGVTKVCREDANDVYRTDCEGNTEKEGKPRSSLNICNVEEKERGPEQQPKPGLMTSKTTLPTVHLFLGQRELLCGKMVG